MITHVSIVGVWVTDIDDAKKFYTEILGFAPKDDITLGEGYRWCTVVPPNQPELAVNLQVPGPPLSDTMAAAVRRELAAGTMHGLGLSVDDCQATYHDLAARGVEFLQPPAERPYGVEALARDNSGNTVVLVQQRAWAPEDFDD